MKLETSDSYRASTSTCVHESTLSDGCLHHSTIRWLVGSSPGPWLPRLRSRGHSSNTITTDLCAQMQFSQNLDTLILVFNTPLTNVGLYATMLSTVHLFVRVRLFISLLLLKLLNHSLGGSTWQ